jgi:hypothetical protein
MTEAPMKVSPKMFSLCRLLATLLLILTVPVVSLAQANFTAQVRGVVKDSTGAVVPKATVTITDDGTQVSVKATTDDFGRYVFNGLRPTSYTMKVEVAGFKTIVHPNIELRVGLQIDQDFSGVSS